ncbi:MAG TPA: hypothetical protein VHT73_04090 [Thermodesulfobacteriota bacterium]|nr:hypothetical protein [Thermodesulfobacteriota bacterium]
MKHLLSKRHYIAIFYLLFVLAVTAFVMITWGEVLHRTAFIVSHVVPGVPDWFESGRYEVQVRRVELTMSNNSAPVSQNDSPSHAVYIYLPQGVEQSSFVIFVPGFTPEGALDPRLVNLARSFAGAGVGVAVPDSETVREKTFSGEDIGLIIDTFRYLQGREYVDRERIGITGFSIAGSYALCAASALGHDPLFVLSLGGYFDLRELFTQVISERAVYKHEKRSWEPDSLSKEVVFNVLAGQIGEKRANELIEEDPSLDEARKYVESLPQEFLSGFNNLSPSFVITKIKTRVFLMHDKNDDIIPVEESRKIRDALPQDVPLSYTEFSILRHVTPKTFFSMDILKFSWQILNIVDLLV